jgi:hypothetical protein
LWLCDDWKWSESRKMKIPSDGNVTGFVTAAKPSV